MSQETGNDQLPNAGDIHFSIDGDLTGLEPWTEIEPGRYMPRRVRGSFRGRALG